MVRSSRGAPLGYAWREEVGQGTVPFFSEIIKIQLHIFFNILKGPMKMFTLRPPLKYDFYLSLTSQWVSGPGPQTSRMALMMMVLMTLQ